MSDELRRLHREWQHWPLLRGDGRASADGYIHGCRTCGHPWPCAVSALLDERDALLAVAEAARLYFEDHDGNEHSDATWPCPDGRCIQGRDLRAALDQLPEDRHG